MSGSASAAGRGGRLFVAVDAGDQLRAEVGRIVGELGAKLEAAHTPPRVTWVKPASLHVTLRFLGEVSDDEAERVCAALAPAFSNRPFDVEWRGIGAFPSAKQPRALWLGVVNGGAALGEIEAEVTRRLGRTSGVDVHPFLPHLTIGRIRMAGRGVDWPKALQAVEMRGVVSRVDHVTVYRSQLSHRGPHYTGLVSAPLVGGA